MRSDRRCRRRALLAGAGVLVAAQLLLLLWLVSKPTDLSAPAVAQESASARSVARVAQAELASLDRPRTPAEALSSDPSLAPRVRYRAGGGRWARPVVLPPEVELVSDTEPLAAAAEPSVPPDQTEQPPLHLDPRR